MMADHSHYSQQEESLNLTTSGMQSFHHVRLSPNDLVMVTSDGEIINTGQSLDDGQQFEQVTMDGHTYQVTHQQQQEMLEQQLQQGYVYVDDQDYRQHIQYNKNAYPVYLVTQSSDQMMLTQSPEPILLAAQSPLEMMTEQYESEQANFSSPPASPGEEDPDCHDIPESPSSASASSAESGEDELGVENDAIDKDNGSIATEAVDEDDEGWESERLHFKKIVATYLQYRDYSILDIEKKMAFVKELPRFQRELLRDYSAHLEEISHCMGVNQNVFNLITKEERHLFANHDEKYGKGSDAAAYPQPTRFDFDKLQAVLKQIVRDWSIDGEQERSLCYNPIIEEVDRRYSRRKQKEDIRILVPGAGLGRLAHELVARQYVVEGNEFSLFMLFASNFILNKCGGNKKYKIHPWIHQHTNVINHLDQTRPIIFPDVDPADTPNPRFSMTAGDFLAVYSKPEHQEAWDCVVTCFFIDCANNVISFIERIYSILKPGGSWISLGPLLYHYADICGENSIEPSLDILLDIIDKIGFSIERSMKIPTKYTENRLSMLNYTYTSMFLCCTKLPKGHNPVR